MKRGCLIGGTLTIIVFAIVVGGWWIAMNADPVVQIPPQRLPPVNARDGYLAAVSAMVRSPLTGKPGSGTLAERDVVLRQNARALQLLRQAFVHPYCELRPASAGSMAFPQYAQFREMARLLSLEASVYADRGEWGRAAQAGLDGIHLGCSIQRGSVLIGMLVGAACEAIARYRLEGVPDHLTAGEARAAAARLEGILARRVPLADILHEEKCLTQMSLMETMQSPTWWKDSFAMPGQNPPPADVLKMLLTSKRRVMRNTVRVMDAAIAEARRPYAQRSAAPPLSGDPVTEMCVSVVWDAGFSHVQTDALGRLLLTQLALRAYRLEHGRYPERLDLLVPAYLARVPEDPFALKGPLRYRRTGAGYLLYSVGPDGKDDGGRPVNDPQRAGRTAHMLLAESMGDVVAGVNR